MIEAVIDIVRQASTLMIREGFEIEQKNSCSNIVTSSDFAIQNFLCDRLSALIPGCGFICEEEEKVDFGKEYEWVIDPIDGTANYSRDIDHCCISVALRKNDEPVLGVVYSPMRDEMYYAEKGGGAFLNGKPIHVSKRSFKESVLCTALCLYRKEYAEACGSVIMDAFKKCNDVRRFGSAAMELCFLACGRCDLFFEIRLLPWDFAAAQLILEEAGGKLTNLDGNPPRIDAPDLACGANSEENHRELLGIIRKHIPSIPYNRSF